MCLVKLEKKTTGKFLIIAYKKKLSVNLSTKDTKVYCKSDCICSAQLNNQQYYLDLSLKVHTIHVCTSLV